MRTLFDAFAQRDHEAAFAYYDAEIEWDTSRVREGTMSIRRGSTTATTAFGPIGDVGCRRIKDHGRRRRSSSSTGVRRSSR